MRRMPDEICTGGGEIGGAGDIFDVILPSDNAWQTKVYYKLVERQRGADLPSENGMFEQQQTAIKLHDWDIIRKKKPLTTRDSTAKLCKTPSSKLSASIDSVAWTVPDIAQAGRLLATPPLSTNFEDEQEMRRVYTLIYDVFRYKNVLIQALDDVLFFQKYPQLIDTAAHVWLLFYDLYHRNFKKRDTSIVFTAVELFNAAGLSLAENALWLQRVKLAASIARLRIHHNALSLSDLLPAHLRHPRTCSDQASCTSPVTCWVNIKKFKNAKDLCKQIENTFNVKIVDDHLLDGCFRSNQYKLDEQCPQIVTFHASMRPMLAKSLLVRSHKLIVQDKSFCLGPATFNKVLRDLELAGSVIQSHINSPRTTAYLAMLLSQNQKIKNLMAFSAGKRIHEYETYFNQLSMTNILLFADRLIDITPDAHYMEEIVAVFATPPNSYSAVKDPIDLVCSRGGDLSMLETLTESEETSRDGSKVSKILDEQNKTLRFAMSRPQIQLVLYETHSEMDAENSGMVQRSVSEMNKIAKLHHVTLQGKCLKPDFDENNYSSTTLPPVDSEKEINNNQKLMNSEEFTSKIENSTKKKLLDDAADTSYDNIAIPDTDIFDVPNLPVLSQLQTDSSNTSTINFTNEGCFLALLQRKQIIRLDHKYMIQMAENRGLFGSQDTASKSNNKGHNKGSRKKPASNNKVSSTQSKKPKRRIKESEVARIAAPTHSFLLHTQIARNQDSTADITNCPRCRMNEAAAGPHQTQYRRWWSEAVHHLGALRSSLIKQKLIVPASSSSHNLKNTADKSITATLKSLVIDNRSVLRIDEIAAAKSNVKSNIPVFPRLKLSRDNSTRVDKVSMELPVTSVEFPFQ